MFAKKSLIFLLIVVILLTACTPQVALQNSPTATTAPAATTTQAKPLTLSMAVTDPSDQAAIAPYVKEFIAQVKSISGGSLIIEPTWQATSGSEQEIIQVVKEGQYDLGQTASRAWDNSGVTSFEALQAPFLITNDDLAKAVATSDTAKQMLASLSSTGLTGLTLWPEDLRHPFSIVPGKSILSPADFSGLTVRVGGSVVTSRLIEQLGGKPETDPEEYQVAESGLRQRNLTGTPTASGNVTFFSKFQVLFANAAAFQKLSDAQQTILREAAAATQKKAIAEHPNEVESGKAWCADGGTIVMASPEQVASFEKAAQPVFEFIEKDPVNTTYIAAIRDLKAKTSPSAGPAACASATAVQPTPQSTPASEVWSTGLPPNGVWKSVVSVDQLVKLGIMKSEAEKEWAGEYTLTYQDGKGEYHFKGGYETSCQSELTVVGDIVRVTYVSGSDCLGSSEDIQWRLEADGLHIHMVTVRHAPVKENRAWYEANPWQKITKP